MNLNYTTKINIMKQSPIIAKKNQLKKIMLIKFANHTSNLHMIRWSSQAPQMNISAPGDPDDEDDDEEANGNNDDDVDQFRYGNEVLTFGCGVKYRLGHGSEEDRHIPTLGRHIRYPVVA